MQFIGEISLFERSFLAKTARNDIFA